MTHLASLITTIEARLGRPFAWSAQSVAGPHLVVSAFCASFCTAFCASHPDFRKVPHFPL
jgi:hypothetical protein